MNKSSAKFITCFITIAMCIYALLEFVPENFYSVINNLNALAAGWLLKAGGIKVIINGDLLSYKGFTAKVVGECSAVFLSVLPFSFFLAYPTSIDRKTTGILIGLPFLFSFNILRIAFIFTIGCSYPQVFPWAHLYIGQVVMILAVIWICLTWLQWEKNKTISNSPAVFTLKVLASSIIPFAAWIWICQPYTMIILRIAETILETFGFPVILPQELEIYPHTFISFNVIIALSILLAKQLNKTMTLIYISTGIVVFASMHIFFQILPILYYQHKIIQSGWMINTMIVINQFILPFVLCILIMSIAPKKNNFTAKT